jgi:hypothetical protein
LNCWGSVFKPFNKWSLFLYYFNLFKIVSNDFASCCSSKIEL